MGRSTSKHRERVAPGQYTYISGEQRTKIDWAVVEGGHINAEQTSDNPPGLSKHRMILIDMTNELSMKLEMETSGEVSETHPIADHGNKR